MKLDSSESENVILFSKLLSLVKQSMGEVRKTFSVKDLLMDWKTFQFTDESELYDAIGWGIKMGIITFLHSKKKDKGLLMFLHDPASVVETDRIRVSVSTPLISKFGLQRTLSRYNFISTKEAFTKVLESAKKVIRVSSPFLERNIVDSEAFPEFPELVLSALERGCELRVISRQILTSRAPYINWLIDLVRSRGMIDRVKLFDYYIEDNERIILSSIHAKMLIADHSTAYIGSAELRRNSISKNFEVGTLISGPSVWGLVELFDLIAVTSRGFL